MRILGIDPGTAIVGYAVVDYENGNYTPLDYGCIFTENASKKRSKGSYHRRSVESYIFPYDGRIY